VSNKIIYLSLGSNLGDREQNLNRALAAMENERIHVIARSSLYETEPQGHLHQPWFLNMAAACETRCFPLQLLTAVQRVEREMGRARNRAVPGGPRLIDIDILLFAKAVVNTSRLTIPHPRLLERRFVLEPLLEIAPDMRHPQTNELLSRYLSKVAGQKVERVR